jgi:hypothetical protein
MKEVVEGVGRHGFYRMIGQRPSAAPPCLLSNAASQESNIFVTVA